MINNQVSKGSVNNYGMGLTIIDSLDTLYIMEMKSEFDDATKWVDSELNFGRTVRYLLFNFLSKK